MFYTSVHVVNTMHVHVFMFMGLFFLFDIYSDGGILSIVSIKDRYVTQIPLNFMGMNLLFFFLLDLINFLKLKWWWGSWPWFFISCYKVFIFMLMINVSHSKIFKSDLYVTNIELWAPISRYSFIVQGSINRFPLIGTTPISKDCVIVFTFLFILFSEINLR